MGHEPDHEGIRIVLDPNAHYRIVSYNYRSTSSNPVGLRVMKWEAEYGKDGYPSKVVYDNDFQQNGETTSKTHCDFEITKFEPDGADAKVFELDALQIPVGTLFSDSRIKTYRYKPGASGEGAAMSAAEESALLDLVPPPLPEGLSDHLKETMNKSVKRISLPGVTLLEAVQIIKTQFKDLTITIDPAVLAKKDQFVVQLDLKDVPLRVLLQNIVGPNGLEYTFVGEGIVIKEKTPAAPKVPPTKE
jgi:hypothetical protein